MANNSDEDNDAESEVDFYQPVGLSPMKERKEPGTQQSDAKFYQ